MKNEENIMKAGKIASGEFAAEKAVKEASGSKSIIIYYEVEMPKCLKDKKMK